MGRIPLGESYEYPLRVVVYNSNQQVLDDVQRVWGGTLSSVDSRKKGWKPSHALIWTNAAAAGLLARVMPSLRVKSVQAAALLEFHRHIRDCPRIRDSRGRLLPLPQHEQVYRAECHSRIKALNTRGPVGGTHVPARAGRGSNGDQVPSIEYLAGFLDGEGSLMINKVKPSGSQNPQYRARIAIANTCRTVLEDLQREYGGILFSNPRAKPGWKNLHQLIWTGGMAARRLPMVSSHLRLKRRQAVVLGGFLHHCRSTLHEPRGPRGRYPPNVIAQREAFYRKLQSLNARGLPEAQPTPART